MSLKIKFKPLSVAWKNDIMIKTFDFLYRAWADDIFRSEIQTAIHTEIDSTIHTDILTLSFDATTRTVHISAISETSPFSHKILPAKISYEGIQKLLEKRFDDLSLDDIEYIS